MMVLRRSQNKIIEALRQPFEENGFDPSDSIAGHLIGISSDNLAQDYVNIYSLIDNTRIDTAHPEFLKHYGILLNEPIEYSGFAKVNDLETIAFYLEDTKGNTATGRSITSSGNGFVIEKGTILYDRSGKQIMKTLHSVVLDELVVYVKAITLSPDITMIPAGTLAVAGVDLKSTDGVDSALVGSFQLLCRNEKDISRDVKTANLETYRYVLQEKSRTFMLHNRHLINTAYDNPGVRDIKVYKINHASTSIAVYVDVRDDAEEELILQEVKQQITSAMPEGTDIRVVPYIKSKVSASLKLTSAENYDILKARDAASIAFAVAITAIAPNTVVNFKDILRTVVNSTSAISAGEIDYIAINGKTLATGIYRTAEIERLRAYPSTISYRA